MFVIRDADEVQQEFIRELEVVERVRCCAKCEYAQRDLTSAEIFFLSGA